MIGRARSRPVDPYAGMNGLERERAVIHEARKRAGEIQDWQFERVTLKLAPDCRYTPDFFILERDGTITLEEAKGHWEDDARVKIRVAADRFPWFRFVAVRRVPKKEGGGWRFEEF